MEGDEVIERPISKILYRQSSVEIRLSPVHFSEESDDNLDNETVPKVVEYKRKGQVKQENEDSPKTPPPSRKTSAENQLTDKNKFIQDLQQKLMTKYKNGANESSESQRKGKGVQSEKCFGKSYTSEYKKPRKIIHIGNNSTDLTKEKNNTLEGSFLGDAQELQETDDHKKEFKEKLAQVCKVNITNNPVPSCSQQSEELKPRENQPQEVTKPLNDEEAGGTNVALLRELNYVKRERDNSPWKKKEDSDSSKVNSSRSRNSKQNMAAVRPKSPRQQGTLKNDKEESFWDKIGTLGRKKRMKEVQEVEAVESEGKYAIESPGNPVIPDIPPEDYELGENEERSMVEPKELDDPKVQELIQVLIEWINDELASQRIIVQDLAEDLYDGQVLQKLLEKLTGDKLDVPEVTQSEEGQKQKLAVVLAHFNKVLGIQRLGHNKWNVEAIHSKNIVPIMHLLVALARHFRPPVRLPEHVSVRVVVVQKTGGQLASKKVREKITTAYDDVGMRCERDAFDTLFDHAPDKLKVVKKSLVTFVNKHLNKINLEVTEIESQFHDGVYLIMLMGLLEGFFVPLYSFYPTPKDFDQKVHNVAFAFELMEEVGLQRPKARPEDVVNMDLKSTLRVLYNLFLKYRNVLYTDMT